MATIDLSREPPDAAFDHPASKRRYRVYRKDDQMYHRELLLTGTAEEVVLADYPVKFVVGSGRHSLTYLVEAEGFLVESPVTWYRARNGWAMSPGYDNPHQAGFQRAIGEGCLVCHAGRSEALDGSLHRMRLDERAIGCERCHGPGELHVARHAGKKPAPNRPRDTIDDTIVHPGRLSRELAESICQQCHLRGNAIVAGRGRALTEFRPGLPLQEFRQDYWLDNPDSPMTVVGHVEQMHLSKCYKGSKTLTCTTCHDPHDEPGPREREAYYQAVCLNCHQPTSCKVAPERRQKERPDNNCVHCHMPTSPTEIPHLAFTHHRIGIHEEKVPEKRAKNPAGGQGVLRAFLEPTTSTDLDRRRSLGLGYLELANRDKDSEATLAYRKRALGILSEVKAAGLRDPALDVSLARLRFDLGLDGVTPLAESALAQQGCVGQDRCNALFLLADGQIREGRHGDAAEVLKELTRLRRHPLDWVRLADCERKLGNVAGMERALETATRIDPRMWKVHAFLAEQHRRRGDGEKAAWHEKRATP